ncbi:Alpha-2-macroglobulin, partial [Durusdinium trenchii]
MSGARGKVRSGGDGMGMRLDAPPPDDEPVALFSGLVKVDENGEAVVSFDVPDFNGALRVITVAWSKSGVGHGEQEIEVRAPVVMTASTPAFLAPGDSSRLVLEIDPVDAPSGAYDLELTASNGLSLEDGASVPRVLDLETGKKTQVILPMAAGDALGSAEIVASLTGPDAQTIVKRLNLDIKDTQPEVLRSYAFDLAPGNKLEVDAASFEDLRGDSVKVTLTAGGAARIDVRSGGDGMGMRLDAPPPDDEPVALFSGLVKVDENGEAVVSFDVPDFNGALRVITVAWSKSGVGHGEQEIEVRAPVVMTASTPAFLAPGDSSRLVLEIDPVDAPSGAYDLELTASNGLSLEDGASVPRVLDLETGKKTQVILPMAAGDALGSAEIVASLTGPDAQTIVKRLNLDIKDTQPEVLRSYAFDLAPGNKLEVDAASFEDLRGDSVKVTLTA